MKNLSFIVKFIKNVEINLPKKILICIFALMVVIIINSPFACKLVCNSLNWNTIYVYISNCITIYVYIIFCMIDR